MIRRALTILAAASVMAIHLRTATPRSYPLPQPTPDPFQSALNQWQWRILDKWSVIDQRDAFTQLTSAQFKRMKSFRRTLEQIRALPVVTTT